MKTQAVLLAALAAAPTVMAHTIWTNFYVDGTSAGDATAVRMRKDGAKASYPLSDYTSDDMACNVDGTTGVSRVQSLNAGQTLTFEMRSWANDPSKPSLDPGHKGPCAFYLKKVDSAVSDPGAGPGWFKLFDAGYDAGSDSWCTDTLIANGGRMSVKIPEGLAGGYYLARPEVLALHNASEGDGQFYTGCGQIFVGEGGDLVPEESSKVSIPGYVKFGEPSVMFNIYNKKNGEYKVPGPAVAKLVSASVSGAANRAKAATQTEGVKPAGCILESSNWCGKEVSSYSNEKGCWASGEECWAQSKQCWAATGPTGGECKIWDDKCTDMNNQCTAKNFNGPPNKGKDLTPKKATIQVGKVMGSDLEVVDGEEAESKPAQSKSASSASSASPSSSSGVAAKPTSSTAAASSYKSVGQAKPSATATQKRKTDAYSTVKPTLTVTQGPEPTKVSCPEGYKCVTQVHTEIVTEYKTVTMEVERRRRGVHMRRRRAL